MKLMRIKQNDQIWPAILAPDNKPRDVSNYIEDLTGDNLHEDTLERLAGLDLDALPLIQGDFQIAPCIAQPPRFFCIGLNYSDHAREVNMELPEYPTLFMKACDVTGANDPISLPRGSVKMDWEVELGVVLGKGGKHITEADAMSHVSGYCVVNDLSERTFQLELGGQWVKGKSCDGFAPVGPWLVTRDEVPNPHALDIYLELNGQRMQDGNTKTMIRTVPEIISHLSQYLTLKAGDIISTGTPPGVGMGFNPPRYLRPGDEMRLGISGLGEQVQRIFESQE